MKNVGLGVKLTLLMGFIVLLTSGGLITVSSLHAYRALEEALGIRLQAIAATGALLLNGPLGDYHRQLDVDNKDREARQAQAQNPNFQKIQAILRKLQKENNLKEALYTFRFSEGKLKFGAMTQEKTFIGDAYTPKDFKAKESILQAFQDKTSTHTKIYRSPNGVWISGHAPFFTSQGKLAGVLAVDIRFETFQKQLYARITRLLLVSLGILVFGLLLGVFFSRWLVRRLHTLREAAEEISLGNMDRVIKIDAEDEIGQLAQSLERMRESLKAAMQMLDEDDD